MKRTKIDIDQIKTDLNRVQSLLNCVPSRRLYEKHGKHSIATIKKHFGSWGQMLQCTFEIIPKENKKISPCSYCQTLTTNPKFCSLSCSTAFNNSLKPKRKAKPKGTCVHCGTTTYRFGTVCKSCKTYKDITLQEAIYMQHHKSSAFALVRTRARSVAKKLGWDHCIECKYSHHIEIAHKKPIADFDYSTMLSIINNPDNLLPLCPNCHWEFDHGLKPHLK